MGRTKGLAEELLERGVRLAIDAAEKVLGDPRGREAVSLASDLAQKAVKKLEELQSAVVRRAGVPTREDLRELEERVAKIQQKAKDLAARMDAMGRDGKREPGRRWRDDPDDMDR
jgi:polyhydroxyalkanoate synthesis regulator phasin